MGVWIVLGVLAAGCTPRYETIDRPVVPLAGFGSVVMGRFSTAQFLDSLRGTARYAKYLPVTEDANRAVWFAVRDRLHGVPVTPGGPRLVVSADLVYFATGSGAARALAWVGLLPQETGDGLIEYRVHLDSQGVRVATYEVRCRITGGSAGAYQAVGEDIVRFLTDHQ